MRPHLNINSWLVALVHMHSSKGENRNQLVEKNWTYEFILLYIYKMNKKMHAIHICMFFKAIWENKLTRVTAILQMLNRDRIGQNYPEVF